MNHSPGPWEILGESAFGHGLRVGVKISNRDETVAVVSSIAVDKDLCKRNAALIAAAPDLLAACKATRSWLIGCNQFLDPGVVRVVNDLAGAIAKAEGRS